MVLLCWKQAQAVGAHTSLTRQNEHYEEEAGRVRKLLVVYRIYY